MTTPHPPNTGGRCVVMFLTHVLLIFAAPHETHLVLHVKRFLAQVTSFKQETENFTACCMGEDSLLHHRAEQWPNKKSPVSRVKSSTPPPSPRRYVCTCFTDGFIIAYLISRLASNVTHRLLPLREQLSDPELGASISPPPLSLLQLFPPSTPRRAAGFHL
jgi:hypothetical protein